MAAARVDSSDLCVAHSRQRSAILDRGVTLFLGMAEWWNIPSNPKARNDRISYKTEQLETKTRNKKEWKRKKSK